MWGDSGARMAVGRAGRGDGRRDRAGGAGRRHGAVRGAGAPLPRPLCALRGADARLPGRRRRRGAGRVRAGVRSPGGLPRARQVCRVVVPDPAQPLFRGAAARARAGRAAGRRGGRRRRAGRPRRRRRDRGTPSGAGARADAAHAGATRGVHSEARGRDGVRGHRAAHGGQRGVAQDAHAPRLRSVAGPDAGAPMTGDREFHPLVKRLLDGELALRDLPPELRAQGDEALRLLGAVDRAAVTLPATLDGQVMERVRRHAASPAGRVWRWVDRPGEVELRVRLRPWGLAGAALAAAAALALLLGRPTEAPGARGAGAVAAAGAGGAGGAARLGAGALRVVRAGCQAGGGGGDLQPLDRGAARPRRRERCVDGHAGAARGPAPVRVRGGRGALGGGSGRTGGGRRVRPAEQRAGGDGARRPHVVTGPLARAALVAVAAASALQAQQGDTGLDARVPAAAAAAVREVAAQAAARGLPAEPLVQKAIEGGAKGVAPDRIVAAVRALAERLARARDAVREAGLERPAPDVVEGGAEALGAGLTPRQVRDLVRASRPPYAPALTLRVAATLAALGVPPRQALALLEGAIAAGRAPGDLLDLPSEVQAGVARGATPAQAAEGLARAAAARPPQGRPPREPPPGQANPRKP